MHDVSTPPHGTKPPAILRSVNHRKQQGASTDADLVPPSTSRPTPSFTGELNLPPKGVEQATPDKRRPRTPTSWDRAVPVSTASATEVVRPAVITTG